MGGFGFAGSTGDSSLFATGVALGGIAPGVGGREPTPGDGGGAVWEGGAGPSRKNTLSVSARSTSKSEEWLVTSPMARTRWGRVPVAGAGVRFEDGSSFFPESIQSLSSFPLSQNSAFLSSNIAASVNVNR